MKRLLTAVLVSSLFTLGLLPATQVHAAPYCGITWGSLPKTAPDLSSDESLTGIDTGRHDCYDRMTIRLNGPGAGYDVQYADTIYTEGGAPMVLAGGAKLRVIPKATNYDINSGTVTYAAPINQPLPGVNLIGYQTFREAKFGGSFEGQSTIGLGVRARLPFRVFKLDNRLVIDVAHYW